MVAAYDSVWKKRVEGSVAAVHAARTVPSYVIVNDDIVTSETQPFLIDGEWIEARDLVSGRLLLGSDGRAVPVKSVKVVNKPTTVYNFEVVQYRTYIAYGIVVHNKEHYDIAPCPIGGCD